MSKQRPRAARPAPAPEPPAREVARLFLELWMRRAPDVQARVAELGLAPMQARTLFLLDPERAMTMKQAAERVLCEPSNLTGIIDKLEARGLVERGLSPTDRRVKMVSLTRAGAALRQQVFALMCEPARWMLALPLADQRRLLELLRKGLALQAAGG